MFLHVERLFHSLGGWKLVALLWLHSDTPSRIMLFCYSKVLLQYRRYITFFSWRHQNNKHTPSWVRKLSKIKIMRRRFTCSSFTHSSTHSDNLYTTSYHSRCYKNVFVCVRERINSLCKEEKSDIFIQSYSWGGSFRLHSKKTGERKIA